MLTQLLLLGNRFGPEGPGRPGLAKIRPNLQTPLFSPALRICAETKILKHQHDYQEWFAPSLAAVPPEHRSCKQWPIVAWAGAINPRWIIATLGKVLWYVTWLCVPCSEPQLPSEPRRTDFLRSYKTPNHAERSDTPAPPKYVTPKLSPNCISRPEERIHGKGYLTLNDHLLKLKKEQCSDLGGGQAYGKVLRMIHS